MIRLNIHPKYRKEEDPSIWVRSTDIVSVASGELPQEDGSTIPITYVAISDRRTLWSTDSVDSIMQEINHVERGRHYALPKTGSDVLPGFHSVRENNTP